MALIPRDLLCPHIAESENEINVSPHAISSPAVIVASCPKCGRRLCWMFLDGTDGPWYPWENVADLNAFADIVRRKQAERK